MNLKACELCSYWRPKADENGSKAKKGVCFYNPPAVVAMPVINMIDRAPSIQPIGVRPTTDADHFCHGFAGMVDV